MNYFKNQSGIVCAFDDEQVSMGYGSDMTPLTPEEEHSHLNPAPTYSQALAKLNAAYHVKIDGFNRQFALAALAGGPGEEAKKLSIRADYADAKTQHADNISQLKIQYGIGV